MRWRCSLGMLCLLCVPVLAHEGDPQAIRLATSTSVQSSGLLEKLVPAFEQQTGASLITIVVGTGRALRMGRLGQVDVLLVHSPTAEKNFIADGFGERRIPIMQNTLLVVGPPKDPAGIQGDTDVVEAFRRIAVSKSLFISRADESGTNKKEQLIWQAADIEPFGTWYYESGLGMGEVFRLANQRLAYTLIDLGTWLAGRSGTPLTVMVERDQRLENQYSVIALSKKKFPDLNHSGAAIFVDWLRSEKGAAVIRSMMVDGKPMFHLPNAH